jgi:hypothetical protein
LRLANLERQEISNLKLSETREVARLQNDVERLRKWFSRQLSLLDQKLALVSGETRALKQGLQEEHSSLSVVAEKEETDINYASGKFRDIGKSITEIYSELDRISSAAAVPTPVTTNRSQIWRKTHSPAIGGMVVEKRYFEAFRDSAAEEGIYSAWLNYDNPSYVDRYDPPLDAAVVSGHVAFASSIWRIRSLLDGRMVESNTIDDWMSNLRQTIINVEGQVSPARAGYPSRAVTGSLTLGNLDWNEVQVKINDDVYSRIYEHNLGWISGFESRYESGVIGAPGSDVPASTIISYAGASSVTDRGAAFTWTEPLTTPAVSTLKYSDETTYLPLAKYPLDAQEELAHMEEVVFKLSDILFEAVFVFTAYRGVFATLTSSETVLGDMAANAIGPNGLELASILGIKLAAWKAVEDIFDSMSSTVQMLSVNRSFIPELVQYAGGTSRITGIKYVDNVDFGGVVDEYAPRISSIFDLAKNDNAYSVVLEISKPRRVVSDTAWNGSRVEYDMFGYVDTDTPRLDGHNIIFFDKTPILTMRTVAGVKVWKETQISGNQWVAG